MIKHKCTYCGGWEEKQEADEETMIVQEVSAFAVESKTVNFEICYKCLERTFKYVLGRIGTE